MYVEGRVLTSSGQPIPGAVIETWETDEKGEQHSMFFSCFVGRFTVIHFNHYLIPRLLRYSVHGPLRSRLPW